MIVRLRRRKRSAPACGRTMSAEGETLLQTTDRSLNEMEFVSRGVGIGQRRGSRVGLRVEVEVGSMKSRAAPLRGARCSGISVLASPQYFVQLSEMAKRPASLFCCFQRLNNVYSVIALARLDCDWGAAKAASFVVADQCQAWSLPMVPYCTLRYENLTGTNE